MPSPFPGMNPYLEARWLWPDVHLKLVSAIQDALAPQVAPGYYVAIEERVYLVEADRDELVGRPDAAVVAARPEPEAFGGGVATLAEHGGRTVMIPLFDEIREQYLEVRTVRSHEVVTAIELLSPTNKEAGIGRREYEAKRSQVLHSQTNLVEIDLLRGYVPMEVDPPPQSDYRILISPAWDRPRARVHAFDLGEPIPLVKIPLRPTEPPAQLALGELLDAIYDRARYDLRLDFDLPPPPPLLSESDAAWLDERLREAELRH